MTNRRIGRYELFGQIAAGGMATVYAGRLLVSGPEAPASPIVAIKRIHEHLARDEELAHALMEEARVTKQIRHPNVVATLDIERANPGAESERGDELLLVMEYVHGETLAGLLKVCARTGQTVPPTIAAGILYGTLLGLHAAHEATDNKTGAPLNIVHRDISPQNIMIGADDGVPRLLDFGIAKAIDSIHHTRTGELKGKIPYMAPEILRFDPATRQSDVWAAAVVFWELIRTKRLFKAASEMEVWGQILTKDIPEPGAGPDFDAIVLRGLERDKNARYATALEMAEAIDRTGRRASPDEIKAWVLSLAGPQLAERLAKIVEGSREPPVHAAAAVAAAAAAAVVGAPPPTLNPPALPPRSLHAPTAAAAPTAPRGTPVLLLLLLGLGGLLFIGVVAIVGVRIALRPRSAASTTTTTASAAPSAPASVGSAAIEPSASASGSGSGSGSGSSAPQPAASSSSVAATSTRHPAGTIKPVTTKPKPTADPCDPPYSLDDGGRRIYKLPCIVNK